MKILVQNRKVGFNFELLETYVAGIHLLGSEVKQIYDGKASLADSHCFFKNSELFLKNMHVPVREKYEPHDPHREKKLLLKKRELQKLSKGVSVMGLTIVVSKIFQSERGLLKAEIHLAKGKKNFDKRASIKDKDLKRDTEREIKT